MAIFETASQLRVALREGTVGAVELLEQTLSAAESATATLNPFVHLLPEQARRDAEESERRLRSGRARPLEGLPLTVKDSLWLEGVEAADGSRSRLGFIAGGTDVAVARTIEAGAVVFAKTTNPEFCLYGYSRSELNGLTRNPWGLERTAGGSSSGAAVALAAGVGPLALGSDGGGSLRIPAAFCGVSAHKPTNGLVPYWPQPAAWPTLSVIGPMARSVSDLRLLLGVIAGHEPADFHSAPNSADPLSPPRRRAVVGVDRDGVVPIEPDVRAVFEEVVEALPSAGLAVVREEVGREESGVRPWFAIAASDAAAALARELREVPDLLEADTREFLRAGAELGSADVAAAQRSRLDVHAAYAGLFERTEASVLITPALGLEAFDSADACPAVVDGVAIERPYDDWQGHLWDANLAGLPACVVPIGVGANGLPVAIQVVGRRFADAEVLDVTASIEAALALDLRPPSVV